MDITEFQTNLVPYPRIHFMMKMKMAMVLEMLMGDERKFEEK